MVVLDSLDLKVALHDTKIEKINNALSKTNKFIWGAIPLEILIELRVLYDNNIEPFKTFFENKPEHNFLIQNGLPHDLVLGYFGLMGYSFTEGLSKGLPKLIREPFRIFTGIILGYAANIGIEVLELFDDYSQNPESWKNLSYHFDKFYHQFVDKLSVADFVRDMNNIATMAYLGLLVFGVYEAGSFYSKRHERKLKKCADELFETLRIGSLEKAKKSLEKYESILPSAKKSMKIRNNYAKTLAYSIRDILNNPYSKKEVLQALGFSLLQYQQAFNKSSRYSIAAVKP